MIQETKNIDNFIRRDFYSEFHFKSLTVRFSTRSKGEIKNLENILTQDNIKFVVKRDFTLKWILTVEIPIIGNYNEKEYMAVLGKFFSLASYSMVNLEAIGLKG
jgi:hypothetical protein